MHRNGQTAKPHQAGSFSFLPLKQTCRPDGRSSHGSTTHPEPITARARACGSGRRHAASKLLRARHDPNPNPNGAGGPGAHSRVTHQHTAQCTRSTAAKIVAGLYESGRSAAVSLLRARSGALHMWCVSRASSLTRNPHLPTLPRRRRALLAAKVLPMDLPLPDAPVPSFFLGGLIRALD